MSQHARGLTAGKPAQQIVPKIIETADKLSNRGNLVVICMDAHEENDPHFEIWPKHNVKGTWEQELYGPLNEWDENHKTDANVLYVPKPEYDAFFGKELDEQLKKREVDTVHLSGVCTDICDFLTAYGAYSRGYKTVAHSECMATFTEQHDIFLKSNESHF